MARTNGNRMRAVELFKMGLPTRQVAQKLGLKNSTVSSYVQWGRTQGHLPHRARGRPEALITGLPIDVAEWLVRTTPEGAEVQDTIRAVLIDAYREEHPDAE